MFTFEELQAMQYTFFVPFSKHNLKSSKINYDPEKQYFTVLSRDGRSMELQSNNTGHCWKLVYEYGGYTFTTSIISKRNTTTRPILAPSTILSSTLLAMMNTR